MTSNKVRKLIREIVEEFCLNEIGEFNYNKTFNPPLDVQNTAKNALQKFESGDKKGLRADKAYELAKGQTQDFHAVRRLRDFFSSKENSLTDENKLEWDLHGGDAGYKWVKSVLDGFHDENLSTKKNLRKAGGAGQNKGMGVFDTSIMDTTKQRKHLGLPK
jgi:hypothetical protein